MGARDRAREEEQQETGEVDRAGRNTTNPLMTEARIAQLCHPSWTQISGALEFPGHKKTSYQLDVECTAATDQIGNTDEYVNSFSCEQARQP